MAYLKNDLVKFCFEVNSKWNQFVKIILIKILFILPKKGFQSNKRYLNINLMENKPLYWKFVYDYNINNVILLEDKFDETGVSIFYKCVNGINI